MIVATPGGERSASGLIAHLLGAHRPVRGDAAVAVGERVDDAVPEPAVDEVAVDEDDRLAPTRLPVADSSLRQVDLS